MHIVKKIDTFLIIIRFCFCIMSVIISENHISINKTIDSLVVIKRAIIVLFKHVLIFNSSHLHIVKLEFLRGQYLTYFKV